jgi:hypothetical protein
MLNGGENYNEFPLTQLGVFITKWNHQRFFDDEKECIFGFVMIPDVFPLQLHSLHVLSIQLTGDRGLQ